MEQTDAVNLVNHHQQQPSRRFFTPMAKTDGERRVATGDTVRL